MISIEKNEIANYLRDYAIMSELIRNNPTRKIGDIFQHYMFGEGRIDEYNDNYFIKMIRVYGIITELKMFSYREDLSIDYLNENELDFDDIKEKIFINPQDSRSFSKKQIIKYIRNAFNHSDNNKRLYNISVNGKYVEINLKNTKPKPFHVKLDFNQLNKINDSIVRKSHNMLMSLIDFDNVNFEKIFLKSEIEKLKFVHFYFPKKVDEQIINKLNEFDFSKCKTTQQIIDEVKKIFLSFGFEEYSIEYFPFKEEQINKAYALLSNLASKDISKFNFDILKSVVVNALSNVIPLGMYQTEHLNFEQRFDAWFMPDPYISYNEILESLETIMYGKEYCPINTQSEEYNNFDKNRFESLISFFKTQTGVISIKGTGLYNDYNTRVKYPMVLYIGFMFDSIITDEFINIDGIEYETMHLRNSFVHGRWFFGENENIELYDCPNGNNNDYNFDWHASINIRKLLTVVDSIQQNMSKKSRR